eukprot:CAMPEP_0115834096 /NCGR_PEP_ID=MMETSP0287-20121206/3509_1 /TAXON_ID=412157 /ORGANISM="Chrysochromulina rotalis, Strain UIO044" /LENGTH=48 /DNA_ID= /DNA_START= /DNA_END= /DNA_ORIENTATION=
MDVANLSISSAPTSLSITRWKSRLHFVSERYCDTGSSAGAGAIAAPSA